MPISRKIIIGVIAAILMVILVAAILLTMPKVEYKRTLVIGVEDDNQALDPQQASWTTLVNWYAFSPLVSFDQKRNVVPDLAESYEIQEGGKALLIKLPTGLKFPSGNPINAYCLNESVYRYIRLSPYSTDWIELNHTEIIDDYTLRFVFNNPPGPLWAVLTSEYGAPVDVETARAVGDEEFNAHPVGAGPFKIKEWVQGSHTTLIPNENYKTNLPFVGNKGPNPHIEEVIIRVIPDDLTRRNEFLAGTIDILASVPSQYVNELKQNPDIVVYEFPYGGLDYIALNNEISPFNDVRVRKAIALALDRSEFAIINENTTKPWYSFISDGMLCSNATVEEIAMEMYAHNIEEAKSLLDAAGWMETEGGIRMKDGKMLSFTLDQEVGRREGVVIKNQLAKVGINVEIREYEYYYIRQKIWNKDFEAAINYWAWVDPDGDMAYWLHSKRAHNATYINPDVDALFDEGMRTFNLTERTAIYSKLQMILLEDLPAIPIQTSIRFVAVHNYVEGLVFTLHTSPLIYLNDVRVVKK